MAIFNFRILLLYSSLSLFFCFLFPQTHSLSFNLTKIGPQHQKNITTFRDASISSEGLQLTPTSIDQILIFREGKAQWATPLHLWDNSTGNLTDFETHFVFVIASNGNSNFTDGLTFFLADPIGSDITLAYAMGLPVNRDTFMGTSSFVAVEFDTFWNGQRVPVDPSDISGSPHVGIDVNSIISNVTAPWYCNVPDGIENEAWIRYDSSSHNLSVVFTGSTNTTRVEDTIHLIIDLRKYLPEKVTFGFTAASGGSPETHTVKSWEFSSSLQINETDKNVTNPTGIGGGGNKTGFVVGLSVGFGVLVFIGLIFCGLWRKHRGRKKDEPIPLREQSMDDEFKRGTGARKFSYEELEIATENFSEERKLGAGGFGGVYRGFLNELNTHVAVKRVSRGSKQGLKEYTSEVKIISQLRHRNLVQLTGWCHDKGELLLVYEFMPNGSLDSHLFKAQSFLNWDIRYKIAQGLVSALFYLHEEWEQCVVHRDIKSSNVMLDSNFNAKLGDFGLARLVDHEEQVETSVVAGTMGYMAPECLFTGKTSKESDVYSFGVVALEIACGRRPVEPNAPQNEVKMVEWVWELYGNGRILEAVDQRLGSEFDEIIMECLMVVGLWCANPYWSLRPSIRQAMLVLNFEAPLPVLPEKIPMPMSFGPPGNSFGSYANSSFYGSGSSSQVQSSTYSGNINNSVAKSLPSAPAAAVSFSSPLWNTK